MWPGHRYCRGNSGEIARNRLKLLLISDQMQISPGVLDTIREEMVNVLSRYAEFDPRQVEIRLVRAEYSAAGESVPALAARIPIRQFTDMRNR